MKRAYRDGDTRAALHEQKVFGRQQREEQTARIRRFVSLNPEMVPGEVAEALSADTTTIARALKGSGLACAEKPWWFGMRPRQVRR